MNVVCRFYNPDTGDHMNKANSITPDPGYIGRNNVQPWEAAGMSYSKQCRYCNHQIGDHVGYIEPEDIPEGYVLEFCAHYRWGFQ